MSDLDEQSLDESVTWDVTLAARAGATLDYEGDEEIVTELWAGGGTAPLATPSTEWLSAPDVIRVTIEALDEVEPAIPPGLYQVRSMIDDAVVARWSLRLTPALIDTSEERVLCTFQELTEACPQLMEMQDVDSRAGFRDEREHARRDIERLIKSKGAAHAARFASIYVNPDDLEDAIDDGRYEVTNDIVRAATARAASLVLAKAMSAANSTRSTNNNFAELAMYYHAQYESIIHATIVRVALEDEDEPEDLDYSLAFPLGLLYVR